MSDRIQAIIWDYDGTLADTRQKNLAVTQKIIERITGRPATDFPVLQSLENYEAVTKTAANWREMYQQQYDMTPVQVDRAGWLWAELQLADTTFVPIFPGIAEALTRLQHFPNGIVSQNARSNILNALQAGEISDYFGCIIGFEEVDIRQQKPEPEGLLQCIDQLTNGASGVVLYIGDHETDFRCAQNATLRLQQQKRDVRVVSVGACYGCVTHPSHWTIPPDHTIQAPHELLDLVTRQSL